MKLRTRVLISIMLLLFLPVIGGIIGTGIIVNYQNYHIKKEYGLDQTTVSSIANPILILETVSGDIFEEMSEEITQDPELIRDREYISKINDRLSSAQTFVVVRIGDEVTYVGNENIFSKLNENIPDYGSCLVDSPIYYINGNFPCIYRQKDVKLNDGSKASVLYVTDINRIIPETKKLAVQVVIILITSIIITAAILIVWIYKSMLKPLNGLSRAANRIKNGDLDFTIKDETDDEIGTLCEDFENMRIRLKESIEKQQIYEAESRELISNISHDLKTPLTAIRGYAEGLMDGVAVTDEKRDKYIRTIYKKAGDVSLLVDELSVYSMIDCDRLAYNFIKIDVGEYFGDCVDEIALDSEVNGIRLSFFNYCDEGTKVLADPEQLRRVIGNIVSNSVKYINSEKGIINIRVYHTDNGIRVEIEDNGIGIGADDLPFIFDRFYRTDASRNSSAKGSGLGLSIARKIIEDHGGEIWATSRENVGTTIYFTLKEHFEEEKHEEEPKTFVKSKLIGVGYLWKRGKQ